MATSGGPVTVSVCVAVAVVVGAAQAVGRVT